MLQEIFCENVIVTVSAFIVEVLNTLSTAFAADLQSSTTA